MKIHVLKISLRLGKIQVFLSMDKICIGDSKIGNNSLQDVLVIYLF